MQIAIERSINYEGYKGNILSEIDDIDALVGLYRTRVLRYVTFSIGDQDLAETITQDCFLKAYNGRASFRGECAVSTWLFSIANNLIRDQLRTKKFQFWRKVKATSMDVTEMASFLPSGETSPEARCSRRSVRSKSPRRSRSYRSIRERSFLLRFSEDLDLSEIAEVTGMPLNTVKTHLHRAVTAIRKRLGAKS